MSLATGNQFHALNWTELPTDDYVINNVEDVEEHRSLGANIISRLDNGVFVGFINNLLVFS